MLLRYLCLSAQRGSGSYVPGFPRVRAPEAQKPFAVIDGERHHAEVRCQTRHHRSSRPRFDQCSPSTTRTTTHGVPVSLTGARANRFVGRRIRPRSAIAEARWSTFRRKKRVNLLTVLPILHYRALAGAVRISESCRWRWSAPARTPPTSAPCSAPADRGRRRLSPRRSLSPRA